MQMGPRSGLMTPRIEPKDNKKAVFYPELEYVRRSRRSLYHRQDPSKHTKVQKKPIQKYNPLKVTQSSLNKAKQTILFEDLGVDLTREILDFIKDAKKIHQTVTFSNQSIYIGPLKNNLQDGFGFNVFPDKSHYLGEWKNGKSNGQGKFTTNDGSIYSGDWQDSKLQGQGTCIKKNGASYEGQWLDHTPNGKGVERFPD
jgi:hypothetical protein